MFKVFQVLSFFLPFVVGLLFPVLGHSLVLDRVIVVVNGDVITASDLRAAEVIHVSEEHGYQDTLLEKLIDEKLLIKEAQRFEIPKPEDGEIMLSLIQLKEKIGSEKVFQKLLQDKGLTQEMVNEGLKNQLFIKRFLDQRINFFVLVTPKELSQYYENHQNDYPGQAFDEAVKKEIERKLTQEKAENKKREFLSKLRKDSEIRKVFH